MPSRPFEDLTGADALRRMEHVWNALDGTVFEADAASGDFVSVGERITHVLDIRATDWLAAGFWTRHLHPDDRAAARSARHVAATATGDYVIAYRLVGEAGRVAHVREVATATRGGDGTVRLVGLLFDVTSQARTEQALARTTRELEEAQRLTHLGHWERNYDLKRFFASGETRRILGGLPDGESHDLESFEALWMSRVHPDDRATVTRALRDALDGRAGYAVEYRLALPDGQIRYVRSMGEITRDTLGRPRRWFGTLQDISERRRAELSATESHGIMRAIVEGTSDAIAVKDLEGRYLMVNRAFADLRDRTIDEIVGTVDVVDGRPGLSEEELAVLASGEPRTFEHTRDVLGARRTFHAVTFPYFDRSETPIGLIGMSRDTTDLKQLEHELRQAQKMEAIGRLAGGVAHNFNNLLTVILGYAEAVGVGLSPGDPNQELVGHIMKGAERAAAMTRQLLTFSRSQTATPRVVDVGAALGELHTLLRPLIAEDIEMSVHIDDGLGAVAMDPGQFEQAMTNLVVNASDAMPSGGRLRVEALNVTIDPQPGTVLLPPAGDYVEVRVWDSGHGMDDATRARIFEPFFTTKPHGSGTGLGLSMAYGFVAQLGGHIDVTTSLGSGTLFRVLLPRSAQAAVPAPVRPASTTAATGTETILLVEDEDAVRNVARLVLESRGYRVLEARNGLEGLEMARAHAAEIDLLLSDLVMPRMNGQQLAEKLALESPDIRVLLMSGYPDRVVPSGAAADPRFEFLSKPFQPSTLARRVRECLDR